MVSNKILWSRVNQIQKDLLRSKFMQKNKKKENYLESKSSTNH